MTRQFAIGDASSRFSKILRLKGRKYLVTARLGGNRQVTPNSPKRSRLQVYDPAAQTLRVIHELPDGPTVRQALASLRRLDRQGGCLPTLLDCERSQGQWRLLTTWIEGQSLAAYLQAARNGDKPWPSVYETVRLYRRFVHGLCQFHQFTASVHGDIAPANLIVQAQPQAFVLIDYGSAWPISNAAGEQAGDGATPGYAAPERFGDSLANHLADQFSASVVFYEMLTGQLPYEGMGGRAGEPNHAAAFSDAYQPPSQLALNIEQCPQRAWEMIDAVASQGLRLSPSQRYANSGEWRKAVDDAWEQIRLPTANSIATRIGEAIAGWIERLTKPSDR